MNEESTVEDHRNRGEKTDELQTGRAYVCVNCSVMRLGYLSKPCPACGETDVHEIQFGKQRIDEIDECIKKSSKTTASTAKSVLQVIALAAASGLVGLYVSRFTVGTASQIITGVLTAALVFTVVVIGIAKVRA